MDVIYLVTGVKLDLSTPSKLGIRSTRCFTWYDNIEDAKKHINNCWVDQKGHYQYIVIERNNQLDTMPEDITWFKFHYETSSYIETEPPIEFKDTMGFTIG